jgi:hypothetical protein
MNRLEQNQSMAFQLAQSAMADLKVAVRMLLAEAPKQGLTNAQIGRTLGIYAGHVKHVGHISRTILELLRSDGVAEQDGERGPWRLIDHTEISEAQRDE